MTLRKRLFWLFSPLLVLVLASALVLSKNLILSRFDQQDATLMSAEAERLRALLDHELKRSLELVQTHAKWDDSYEFMHGQHPDFLRRNIDPDSLQLMDFDFMIFLDRNDEVYAEQWIPPDLPDLFVLGTEKPRNYASLRASILGLVKRLHQPGGVEDVRGQFVVVQGLPLMLAMSNISNNQNSLPSVGTLVAGHFIDSERAERMQGQVEGALRLLPPPSDGSGWRALPVLNALNLNQIGVSPRRVLDGERQQISLLFRNSLGEPQLLLELTRNRSLYNEGLKAIAIFLAQATAVGLVAWLLIYLGLEFAILRRVSRMNQEIAAIGPDSTSQRLSDAGRDELGQLASEANRMLERLEQSEIRDRQILDAIQDGYFELEPDGVIVAANRALCEMLGYPHEQLLRNTFAHLLSADDSQRARQLLTQARDNGSNATFAAALRRQNGSLGYYETRFSLIHDGQGNFAGYRGVLRDISDQMAYQNQLLDMAYRDPLTNLGNRKAFTEQLKGGLDLARQQQGRLALLYLDLDRFKEVNDRFGHDVGDTLLQKIAERLRNTMRQPDRVYRLGGDEFTLLLQDADASLALKLADRLLAALGTPLHLGEQLIDFVTPSIGIALFPDHAEDPESLVKAADSAMYQAKQQRNSACLYQRAALSSTSQSR